MQTHQRQYPFLPQKSVTVIALLLTVCAHIFFLRFWFSSTDNKPSTQKVLMALSAHSSQKYHVHKNILDSEKGGNYEHQVKSDAQREIENPPTEPASRNKTYYFKYDEVSSKPVVITDLPPNFSLPTLLDAHQTLILTLLISDNGEIDEVLLENESIDENARNAIVNAFKTMKFEAARIDDISVPSEIRIEARENAPDSAEAIE